ncbi:MAG TPA: lipopolysaccharide heptosyltransferase II [Candidatus Dormibacteraeota bacterium]|nr:lipopolysaccharide heptosyltransferase II [Candidatus Dormibacteraeota bacterium]
MKILILKPSSLGDVVQALPVLRLIKRQWPESEIYWWIESGLAPLLEGDPDLTGVIPFDRKRWGSPLNWLEVLRSIRSLREARFDLVIDLQCLARSASVGWLANGKQFVGLDVIRESARAFYDVIVPRPVGSEHAVDWYLAVLPQIGVRADEPFTWLIERPSIASQVRQRWQVADARWLVLQPGARWETKKWPVEYYVELARQLTARNNGFRLAILGGEDDRSLGETIAKEQPERCLDLTGRLSLPEMVEWLRLSELMVTNDTGPMHVAAALGKPVIALFGPTNPRRTGPYGQTEQTLQTKSLPCVPCMKGYCSYEKPLECLRSISVGAVVEQVSNILSRG